MVICPDLLFWFYSNLKNLFKQYYICVYIYPKAFIHVQINAAWYLSCYIVIYILSIG